MAARIGLLGGTFDPIHFGHLRAAEEAYQKLALDKVIFLPTAVPPHKKRPDLSPFSLRFEMVRLALSGVPYFEVSDLERRLPKPSYSVKTLEVLKEQVPGGEFFFILGFDAFLEFETWYEYQRIPTLAHLIVVTRGGGDEQAFAAKVRELFPESKQENNFWWRLPRGFSVRYLPILRLDISSTFLRKAVKNRESIRFLTPDPVRDFIFAHGLYATDFASPGAREDCDKSPE